MKRFRVLLAAGGFAIVALGLLLRPADVTESAEAISGIGRYRDGRGRFGREGPLLERPVSAPSDLLTDLLAYYKLDGDVLDATGAHNGTVHGSPAYVAGQLGSAFDDLGDSSRYVEIGSGGLVLGTSFTFAAWVKSTGNAGQYQPLVRASADSYKGFWLDSTAHKLSFRDTFNSNKLSTTVVPDNVWTHVAASYDGAVMRFYVDGATAGTQSFTISTVFGPALTIDTMTKDDSAGALVGLFDEPGFWTRVLSASEVAQLYNSGAGKAYPF